MRDFNSGLWKSLQAFVWGDQLRLLPMPRRLLIGTLRLGHVLLRETAPW